MRKPALALVAALAFATAAYAGKNKFDPPLAGESKLVKLLVHEIRVKKKDTVHLWATIENKSDKQLTVSYGNFRLEVGGNSYAGALKVFPMRIEKDFEMAPKAVKKLPGPLEFRDVPRATTATFQVAGIRVGGAVDPEADTSVPVPLDED